MPDITVTIGTTVIPTPSVFSVNIYDITDSKRNANGDLIAQKLSTKRKLELSYKYLSSTDNASIMSLFNGDFFQSITYYDPVTNAYRTGTFYVGDRNCPSMDWINGTIRYKDVKFNLIER